VVGNILPEGDLAAKELEVEGLVHPIDSVAVEVNIHRLEEGALRNVQYRDPSAKMPFQGQILRKLLSMWALI
jgi:hypothetical protein